MENAIDGGDSSPDEIELVQRPIPRNGDLSSLNLACIDKIFRHITKVALPLPFPQSLCSISHCDHPFVPTMPPAWPPRGAEGKGSSQGPGFFRPFFLA